MAWRTSADQVQLAVETGNDAVGDPLQLDVFIEMANAAVDDLDTYCGANAITMSAKKLKVIETLLACHFYSLRDMLYSNKSTAGASGGFQVGSGNGFQETSYGRNALAMDHSGYLASMNRGRHTIQFGVATTYNSGDPINDEEEDTSEPE